MQKSSQNSGLNTRPWSCEATRVMTKMMMIHDSRVWHVQIEYVYNYLIIRISWWRCTVVLWRVSGFFPGLLRHVTASGSLTWSMSWRDLIVDCKVGRTKLVVTTFRSVVFHSFYKLWQENPVWRAVLCVVCLPVIRQLEPLRVILDIEQKLWSFVILPATCPDMCCTHAQIFQSDYFYFPAKIWVKETTL